MAAERLMVVEISSVDRYDHSRHLSNERYVAASIGDALNRHAPDPAPRARFEVVVIGSCEVVSL